MLPMAQLRDSDARLDTIRALLAKADATTFEAEAEAFTAKATELMARYAIDAAMLWSGESEADREVPDEIHLTLLRPFTAQKSILVAGVASAFGCQALRLRRGGQGGEVISVVGFPSDLTLVETLITSLLVQLSTAMVHSPDQPRSATSSQVSSWRRSFISAFADTVIRRLIQDRRGAMDAVANQADGPSTNQGPSERGAAGSRSIDLVLADRADAVHTDFRRRYPNIRTSRVSAGTSRSGHRAGTAAGNRADIGHTRLGARPALPGRRASP